MAGLVYSAYHGCLQERYPISHSSCFDVWYRGLPVPRTGPVCAAFELAACGKDQHLPAALLLPSRSSHLMSIGVCDLYIAAWKTSLCLSVPQKAWHHTTKTWRTFLQTVQQRGGAGYSDLPPTQYQICFDLFFHFVLQCADKITCCFSISHGVSKPVISTTEAPLESHENLPVVLQDFHFNLYNLKSSSRPICLHLLLFNFV